MLDAAGHFGAGTGRGADVGARKVGGHGVVLLAVVAVRARARARASLEAVAAKAQMRSISKLPVAFAGQVETVGLALAVRAVARNVAAGCGWCAEPEGGVVDCPDGDVRAVLRGDCDLGCSERSVPHGVELPLDGFGVGQVPEGIGVVVGCDFVELWVRIVAGVGSEQERGLGFVQPQDVGGACPDVVGVVGERLGSVELGGGRTA